MTYVACRCSLPDLGIGRLFEAIHAVVIAADADSGRIVLWIPASERIVCYFAASATAPPLKASLPAYLKARHRAEFVRCRTTGRGRLLEASQGTSRGGGAGPARP